MKSEITCNKRSKKCGYQQGSLYKHTKSDLVLLCTQDSGDLLKGAVISEGDGKKMGYNNNDCGWNRDAFEPFYGTIVCTEE